MKKLILVLGFLFLGIGVIGFFYGVGAEPQPPRKAEVQHSQ